MHWHPSIHMPKQAARIFLRVKEVRVDWLQAMDEEAAIAEGFADSPAGTDAARYTAVGNGWTVDVIAYILRGLREETK